MVRPTPKGALRKAEESEWSDWSDWVALSTGSTPGFNAYFNRGIVASQWLARQHTSKNALQSDINQPNSKNRKMLSGVLRVALLDLLKQAKQGDVAIYAALYEINDPEIIAAFTALGARCNLILGSGAYKGADKKRGTPAEPDENAKVRAQLRDNTKINLHDRLVKSPHFAHNKFIVFCDKNDKPVHVWTGSTNCTITGLCTQVNNGVWIDSADLAQAYRTRWDELKNAGAGYPASLAQAGSTPAKTAINGAHITAWNVPCENEVDLAQASKLIKNAKEGVLFLMFNPGPKGTLLNVILGLNPSKIFVHGVINQDPGGKKAPLLQVVHRGKKLPAQSLPEILPKGLTASSSYFDKTFQFSMVMIHSKVVVLDPFGAHPVVMTGSHNLGPKASAKNDDNLVIIENAPGLAAEYAVNILGVYGHYKWLYNQGLNATKSAAAAKKIAPKFDGLADDDKWQSHYLQPGPNKDEIDFWLAGAKQKRANGRRTAAGRPRR